jgi:hypothetical protein
MKRGYETNDPDQDIAILQLYCIVKHDTICYNR